MQYGITSRDGWFTAGKICNPRPIWEVWDNFGIADATMKGFWENKPAVTASDDVVKVTAYIKKGDKTLLSIGNYSDEAKTIHLNIDWKQLGLNPKHVKLCTPEVPAFQRAKKWEIKDTIHIEPKKGYLIYVGK